MRDNNKPNEPRPFRFRDDIDLAKTWVISDTHFGHENIVKFCHRPLDHDELMIANIRAAVGPDDTLLHLGDLCYKGNAYFQHIVANGSEGLGYIKDKKLVLGNHDRSPYSFYRKCGFMVCQPFGIRLRLDDGKLRQVYPGEGVYNWAVSFSHYPWSDRDDCRAMSDTDLRLHGHIHNNGYTRDAFVPFLRNHINLSVEQTKYRPVNLGLLLDAVLLGKYPETTDEQLAVARERKEARQA